MNNGNGLMIFFYTIIGVIAIAGVIWNGRQKRKRRLALQDWATRNGWIFDPGEMYYFDERYPAFYCLSSGDCDRYACNQVMGFFKEQDFHAFDYHYAIKTRQGNSPHYFSAIIMESPFPLKPLFIRPESLLDKMGEFLGFEDINFESAEFSRKFYVKAQDKRWAYDVISPRMMEYLLQSPTYYLQFDDRQIIVYHEKRFEVAEFQDALYLAHGLFERLPDYLVRQQQGNYELGITNYGK